MTYAIAYRGRHWWIGELRFPETKRRENLCGMTNITIRAEEIAPMAPMDPEVPAELGYHGPKRRRWWKGRDE